MIINKKKSGIIFFLKKKGKTKGVTDIEGYPCLPEYKYLGMWIDERMSFEKHYEEVKKKIEKGIKMINIMKWKRSST